MPATGVLLENFGQNPLDNTQFGIIQTLNPDAASIASMGELAQTVSGLLDEPINAYITERNDGASRQIGLWGRGSAGETRENVSTTITTGTFSLTNPGRLKVSHQTLQAGLDYGLLGLGGGTWNLHFGVTGGAVDADGHVPGTQIHYNASFAGGYIGVTTDRFSLDGTVRHEWRKYDVVAPTLFGDGFRHHTEGGATAASVQASYRFGGVMGVQLVPFVGYRYADSGIDPLAIDNFTTFNSGSDKTSIGNAGLRVSFRGQTGNLLFEPFVSARYIKNWSNSSAAAFTFNGGSNTTLSSITTAWDDARQYQVGLMGSNLNRKLSAFVIGTLNDGDLKGGSVSVGARINF